MCTGNPATGEALALPKLERTVAHRKALPDPEGTGCLGAAEASGAGATSKLALVFLILTATRPGETREARWEEMDFGGADCATLATRATWIIPKERIKTKRDHRVPFRNGRQKSFAKPNRWRMARGLCFPVQSRAGHCPT